MFFQLLASFSVKYKCTKKTNNPELRVLDHVRSGSECDWSEEDVLCLDERSAMDSHFRGCSWQMSAG